MKRLRTHTQRASLLIIALLISGLVSAQISVNVKKQSIRKVIQQIEKTSDYSFFYSEELTDLDTNVDLKVTDNSLSDTLDKLFSKTSISYQIKENKQVVLTVKQKSDTKATQGSAKKSISGTIVDDKGEPIIGATVNVSGTTNGALTDIDGNFTLEASSDDILLISYLGYHSQKISVKENTNLSIKLIEDTKMLDEVIVVGYGSTSVKKIVSSVTAIKGETLQDLPYATMAGALQGRATGVIVQQAGGEPGSTPTISIRGGSDPIYVIDGVISNSFDFNMINPVDIENVSILKDAASLAVYGSRAADGIVMVKTKQGVKGQKSITYSFNAQFSQPTMLPKKIDAYKYASLQNSTAMNEGYSDYYIYDEGTMDAILNQTDPYRYANTDWVDLGLKKFAPEYRHSLSMNGNSKDINYYLSLGMVDQGSLYTSNALNHDRYTLRSNVNTTFEEIGLKISLNVNGAIEKQQYPSYGAGQIWDHLFSRFALSPAYNEDGTYTTLSDHPLVEMDKRSGYNRKNRKFINTQFVANWDLPWVDGLALGTMLNYRLSDTHQKIFTTSAPQYSMEGELYKRALPTLKEEAWFDENYNFEVNASYAKTFAEKHAIDLKAVFTVSEIDENNFWASRKDYLSSTVDQLFAGSPIGQLNSGKAGEDGKMGVVGRAKYDFDNRYMIEGSFRYDGSDNFAPGHRWGFFPSVAVAWDLTEEPFFQNLNLDKIQLVKFRGSYGKTGTTNGVNRFGYLSVYDLNENVINIGGNLQHGFSEGALVSPSLLSWYNKNSLNYGVDLAFLDNRLKATADYFFFVTKGGLMSPAERYITPLGKPLPQIKSDSEHRREGFELSMRWGDTFARDFTYDVGVNMTYFNNLWVKKADESITDLMDPRKRTTHQTDFYHRGYIDTGLYQNIEQILNSPRRPQSTETRLGDIGYKDINGDGKIDDEDLERIGQPTMPHYSFGIDFSFGYKGFSLSGLFYGTGKRNIEHGVHYKKGESRFATDKAQMDFWREDNKDAAFPRLSTGTNANGSNNQQRSTFWLENASFFRLKDLQLGYDLKHIVLRKVKWISLCRVNIMGTNLFTISKTKKYFDPETASTGGSYPVQRVYSFGLTVGF